jgi:plastocyanin
MTKLRTTTWVRRLAVVGAALLLVGALAVAAGAAAASGAKTVNLGDNFFKPTKVTVTAGTAVTWKWTGGNTHNVTVVSGPEKFHSGDQDTGTYSHTMVKPGTYKIVCTFHPGMEMTLKVKKAPANATTTTSAPSSS